MSGPSEHTHEPVTPLRQGRPPEWIVLCLDCGFAHDAHGRTGGDAVQAVAPTHAATHRLIARAIDYTAPVFGADQNRPHPLYHGRR